MNKYIIYISFFAVLIISGGCAETVKSPKIIDQIPVVFPDYTGVTIPVSIAPLNFRVEDEYTKIDARIKGMGQDEIHVQGDRYISIPDVQWKKLLAENINGHIRIVVSIKRTEEWYQYQPFTIYISEYPIDYGLVYRLIAPGYETYGKMGIYQRELSGFEQTALLENTLVPAGCMNCHSFCLNDPGQMSLHLRGKYGGTVIMKDDQMDLYDTKTDQTITAGVYPFWHPSGKYIAYSVNQTQQAFHEVRDERIEVFDMQSDIVVYNTETNEMFSCPQLKSKEAFETYPSFSPDGRTLYFCTAEAKNLPDEYDQLRYSLCSISFNPETATFGNHVDTLVSAKAWDKSVSLPRPSPDGKYLMYTMAEYGNFLIWHREADLWLMDLRTGETREITEANSDDADSYHSWSNNSHWFVFGSRRLDGLYTRPYIASVDDEGKVSKPFLLPQHDPEYYDLSLYSFNVPEFVSGPVKMNAREVEKKALSGERKQIKYRGGGESEILPESGIYGSLW